MGVFKTYFKGKKSINSKTIKKYDAAAMWCRK